jgi:hypothetical protein
MFPVFAERASCLKAFGPARNAGYGYVQFLGQKSCAGRAALDCFNHF